MFVVYVESNLLLEICQGKQTNTGIQISPEGEKESKCTSAALVPKTNPLENANVHKCYHCGQEFTLNLDLQQHYMIHTGEKPFECKICLKRFNKKSLLAKHTIIHVHGISSVKVRKCYECGKQWKSASGYNSHNRIYHKGNAKVHKCDLCDKEYTEKSSLKQHYMNHTGEKPFECENCGKRFNKKGSLVKHFAIHVPSYMLKCYECGKEFKSSSGLSKHKRITHYLNFKVHSCELCGKEYDESRKLKQHYMAHTGEKPFECENCGKRYRLKGSLSRHMAIHATVQIHKCSECGKEFKSRNGMLKHKQTHFVNVKVHMCDLCGKKFSESAKLKLHCLSHTGKKTFECEIC